MFDRKQDYRHLLQGSDDILVLPWSELKFNPLKPPEDVPPRRWAQVFAEIFGHSTALLSASKNYVMKRLLQLYRAYDLFEEASSPYPSLHEFHLYVAEDGINYMRASADYRDRVLNRVEAMLLSAGTVFDCSDGYPLQELLGRDVVFEVDGLGTDVQNFLMEILFAAVYEYRVAQNQRGGDLRHVFFLDEGKRVFSVYKERQDAAGIPTIDDMTAKMREFGEGLVVADQEASKLTDSIKANTLTKILLATGDAKQFEEMAGSLGLTTRQREVAQRLDIGEAVVQTGNQDPVPVCLDNYELEKNISDEELRKRQGKRWNRLTSTPRETPLSFEQQIHGGGKIEIPDDTDRTEIALSDAADRFLNDVVENPFKPLTDRYEEFSSVGRGNQVKDELVDAGLVIERNITTEDSKRKLLELTERGREYLEDRGIDVERRGRGGIAHRYWQHRIAQIFEEAGEVAKVELFDADVYVNMDDTELVVEIAMGNNPREIEHVRDHLDTFDMVWVVCQNKDIRDGLRERMEDNVLLTESVEFHLFHDFRGGELPSF